MLAMLGGVDGRVIGIWEYLIDKDAAFGQEHACSGLVGSSDLPTCVLAGAVDGFVAESCHNTLCQDGLAYLAYVGRAAQAVFCRLSVPWRHGKVNEAA